MPDSGIEGKVTIGPSYPEVQHAAARENSPFETSLVIVESKTQQEVTTVRSGADGTFRVELPPGNYIVKPPSPNQFVPPYADPQQVTVHEGEFATIEIVFDSGIR